MALSVKHLNPRQGITTRSGDGYGLLLRIASGVKHLNPRQGITTALADQLRSSVDVGVKHLNPRQGITTKNTVNWDKNHWHHQV